MAESEQHIVVLGAGVTGLTSALLLAEAGYTVTVIAAHVPGDSSIEYTSPWAGAHWLPFSRVREDPKIVSWDLQTYDYWFDMIRQEEKDPKLSQSGLKQIDSYEFWDKAPDYDIWYAPYVGSFRSLSAEQEPISAVNQKASSAGGPMIACGAFYKAMSINVPRYLLYLQERSRAQGVKVIKARLATEGGFTSALQEAGALATADGRPEPVCYVNATGLGAKKLCGDQALFPIRGQTVLVKGEAPLTITRSGDGIRAYVIPRPGSGTTILGGTREEGVWDETPDEETTETILRQNAWQIPELLTGPDGGFEVLSVQCGLRPARRGGPRMEAENVGAIAVVHAYGHGGAGYQNSVGSARAVVGLVGESLARGQLSAKL